MLECYEELLSKEIFSIITDIWYEENTNEVEIEEIIKYVLSNEYAFKKTIVLSGMSPKDILVFSQKYLGVMSISEMGSILPKSLKKWFKGSRSYKVDLSDYDGSMTKEELLSAVFDVYCEILEEDIVPEANDWSEALKKVLHDEYGVRKLLIILGMEPEEFREEARRVLGISAISKYIGKGIRRQMKDGQIKLSEIDLSKYC